MPSNAVLDRITWIRPNPPSATENNDRSAIGALRPCLWSYFLRLHTLTRSSAPGFSAPSTPMPAFLTARGSGEYVLAILLVAVVAVTEEIISRGYLILRVTTVTGSSALAIALSSVIFSLGHGYEGTAGVVTVGVIGLTFALVYVWAENLAAPIL